MSQGILYVVPTPVGNLKDMTFRAIEILRSVSLILAEDTRTTGFLLKHYEIETPKTSHHKFNEHKTVKALAMRILAGESIALVSDAGTPSISDPGFLLVRECVENGIKVECLPGATAMIPALVVSGFSSDRFCFEGFLPQKKGRQKRISALLQEPRTMIFYESPYRIVKALDQFSEAFGADRRVCVVREISKMFEEAIRGTIAEVKLHFETHTPKGEFVVVVEGFDAKSNADIDEDE